MQEWQLQAACEIYGYEGVWEVPEDEIEDVVRLAMVIGD